MPRFRYAGSGYRAGRLVMHACAVALPALLLVPTAGWSACAPNGAAIPNGASVTCSGTDVTGVGNYTQDNVTVNVQQGASITLGDNSGAINLNNNAVVTNNGSITGGFNATSITADNNSILTNAGLLSGGDNAQGFEAQSGNTITNTSTGAITLGTGSYGINAVNSNKIVNNGAITGGAGTFGISLNQNNSVTNNGTIKLGSTTVGPFGSWGIVLNHGGNTVVNNGSITVGDAIHSSVSGIVDQWGSNTITNNGIIAVGGNFFGFKGGATGVVLNDFSTFANTGSISVGANADAVQFNGPGVTVNNSGRIVAGANGWSLMGYNMFTGQTTVSNSGTLDGRISLQNDSTLTNSGLITITDPGTPLAAGNFAIIGTFTQSASGLTALRATAAGQFDSFAARSANLGGTLGLVLQPALYGDSTSYKGALVTNTPINGTFAQTVAYAPGTTIPLAFFSVTPTYNSTSIDLTLNRLGFGAVAGETSNERAVGNALNAIYSTTLTGNAATFFLNLLQATSAKVLDPLTGEGTAGTQNTAFLANTMFMTTLADQTNTWRNGDRVGIPATDTRLGYAGENSGPFAKMLKAPPAYVPTWHGWASGFGGAQSLKGDAAVGSADFSDRFAGGAGGIDYEANPGLLIGGGAGASRSTFSVNDQATSGKVDGLHVGGYAMQRFGATYVSAVAGYSRFDNATSRTITGLGPTETASGTFSSDQAGGRLELGHTFGAGSVDVTPFAAAQASRLWQRGYTETSLAPGNVPGQFGLTYQPVSVWSLPTFLGAQLDTRIGFANGVVWSPYLRAAWVHEFNTTRQVSAFVSSFPASPFTVDGARAARDSAKVDLGSRLLLTANIAAIANFTGEFAGRGQQMYAGTGTLRVNW